MFVLMNRIQYLYSGTIAEKTAITLSHSLLYSSYSSLFYLHLFLFPYTVRILNHLNPGCQIWFRWRIMIPKMYNIKLVKLYNKVSFVNMS